MRGHALLALAAAAGFLSLAQPAAAQGYYDDGYGQEQCERDNRDRMVGAVILGAIVGGVIGNNAAAGGHQGDGTIVGGLLGGLTGGAIGSAGQDDCGGRYGYGDDDAYYAGGGEPYYSEDDGYYEDSRQYAANDQCRWGEMEYVDRRGRHQRTERVWMCMGGDGVWRPQE